MAMELAAASPLGAAERQMGHVYVRLLGTAVGAAGKQCARGYSSGLKGGRDGCAQASQFSRILKANRLTHAVIGTKIDLQKLDELLAKISAMRDPSRGYFPVLTKCGEHKALQEGKRVHAHILLTKSNTRAAVCNALIDMYAKCGCMDQARLVFNTMLNRTQLSWGYIISGYVKNGMPEMALDLYHKIRGENITVDSLILSSVIAACAHLKNLEEGKQIHERVLASKLSDQISVGNALVNMYAKCGDLLNARSVFEGMEKRNLVTWNAIISGYVQQGQPKEALRLYGRMGPVPDKKTYTSVLTACSLIPDVSLGRRVHERLLASGAVVDTILQNALMNMYAKCGELDEARKIFQMMQTRDVVAWTTLITAYTQHGHCAEALDLYYGMKVEHVRPSVVTFSSAIAACSTLEEGRAIREDAAAAGCGDDVSVQTALLGLYGRCGHVEDAKFLFDTMPKKDVVSWSSMLSTYAQNGYSREAIELFHKMVSEGVEPSPMIFSSILLACSQAQDLEEGKSVHSLLLRSPWKDELIAQSALLNMYVKCGSLEDARNVFAGMKRRDVCTWAVMLAACVQNGAVEEVLKLYRGMDVEPDEAVYVSVVAACASLRALEQGRAVHQRARPRELEHDSLAAALLDMYVKCGSLDEAQKLFDELPSKGSSARTVMIGAHLQNKDAPQALKLFRSMDLDGIEPNRFSLGYILGACSSLKTGRDLHARIVATGLEHDHFLVARLIEMYCRCGSLRDARILFDQMQPRDVHSWNALIAGYNRHDPQEVLNLYRRMLSVTDIQPNGQTFLVALNACSCLGDIEEGRKIHRLAESYKISTIKLSNALVNMYAKCGSIGESKAAFERIAKKTSASWATMLAAYLQNGYAREALETYRNMDVEPSNIAYASALNACALLGSLEDGEEIHARIKTSNVSSAFVESALVNMYARCGAMVEAKQVFNEMLQRDTVCWNAMMTAYAQHGAVPQVLELYREMVLAGYEPDAVTFTSILVSCGQAGKSAEAFDYFKLMSEHGVSWEPPHYHCMTTLLARAGDLAGAEEIAKSEPSPTAWGSLLSACRDLEDAGYAERAAEHVLKLDPVDTSPYVLLSTIYKHPEQTPGTVG